jgi:hypothetical protein
MIKGVHGENLAGNAGVNRGREETLPLPDFLAQQDFVPFLDERLRRLAEVLEERDHNFLWRRHGLESFIFSEFLEFRGMHSVGKSLGLHALFIEKRKIKFIHYPPVLSSSNTMRDARKIKKMDNV